MHRRRIQSLASGALGFFVTTSDAEAAMPERIWGTYYGGDSPDGGLAVAVDAVGDIYVAGDTWSDEGIATPGAHKTIRQAEDTYLVKFDAAGQRVWGTYFGGMGGDYLHGIVATDDGVVIVGRTNSIDGISTPGSHQPVAGGALDGFVARFDADGVQVWGTYLASNFNDGVFAVAHGEDGSIYVGGTVKGPLPGLATDGAYQTVKAGGDDGFVGKLDAGGQVVWGTYYGGAGSDHVQAVTPGPDGSLYLAGNTRSDEGIASPGAHDVTLEKDDDIPEPTDVDDAFVARLADGGARVWGTYYGGDDWDGLEALVVPADGGVIACGASASATDIATPGAFKTVLDGGNLISDAILVRFDGDGALQWGTYYGGTNNDICFAMVADHAGDLLLYGITNSTGGISTPDAFLPNANNPLGDAFLARFSGGGDRVWGTFFGGTEQELVGGIATAGGRIYISGQTRSPEGIATPGTHLDQLTPALNTQGYLVRFSQGPGKPCAGPDECLDGFCVDGVCCDSACDGDCDVCGVDQGATIDGVCAPLAADVVCRPAAGPCDAAELCPGDAGVCPDDVPVADGEPCQDGLCAGGVCEPQASTTTTTTGETSTGTGAVTGEATASSTSGGSSDVSEGPGGTMTPPTGEAGGTSDGGTGGTGGTGEDTDDGGCDCRSGDAPAGLFGLWVLAVRRRRRAK